jgi:hypothetical protein
MFEFNRYLRRHYAQFINIVSSFLSSLDSIFC